MGKGLAVEDKGPSSDPHQPCKAGYRVPITLEPEG